MRSRPFIALSLCFFLFVSTTESIPQGVKEISVIADKPVAEVKPTMWGVFFEDINFAADGGLYAELIKNRSFEFSMPLMGWKQTRQNAEGRALPTFYSPADDRNPHFLRLMIDAGNGSYGLTNEGFRGMGVREGVKYIFSFNARVPEGSDIRMTVRILGQGGRALWVTGIGGLTSQWQRHSAVLSPTATDAKATLQILFSGKGTIDLDLISLFPEDTWQGRPGGLRSDLVQMIADLKPGFLRFPGGCIVEGRDINNRYQWKYTVGPVQERKLIYNRWNMEMRDRQAPDYFQSFGLGFYEYFQLAEDIGAEPLPILNCGMSCQFNAAEVVPLDQLDPYIQDALDLIEFANGDTSTQWGKLREDMGHSGPFNLKFIGVGNEQWDEQYLERYAAFEKVLKEKHPEIMIVSGSGPSASGKMFDYAWSKLKTMKPDLIDEHYYMPPEWFFKNAGRYDKYDRNGIKVFAGEYAAHGKESDQPESRNTWYSALAEAAFMTGLERNADVVNMASYAPLLAHVEAWQWRPDLIWFDNLKSIGTPNYYVQKLFSNHRGTHVVQVLSDGQILAGQDSVYASGTIDRTGNKLYIKLVNIAASSKPLRLNTGGISLTKDASLTVLSGKKTDFNTMADPERVIPVTRQVALTGKKLDLQLEPLSVNVLVINLKN
ncbi:MAG TPA: alpha-L-arabinofuranosidase C-terminal domain-containing protein [Bacteroidales bacterium]|nr:alpha-L-arabinofuranosidase C-terminal domain-containing protein [Bacteroidales bacterium]